MGVPLEILFILVLAICLTYTYTNGFQDGSSVSASAIGSRALTPLQTVSLVATFELGGALFGGSSVASTVHSITSWPDRPDLLPVLASGLSGAVLWNFITRQLRFPSSSTHALIGGLLGALFAASGNDRYIVWGDPDSVLHSTAVWRVAFGLFLSPLIGFTAGCALTKIGTSCLSRASTRVNRTLCRAQWLSTAVLAFGHGANDTQKAMGVMLIALRAVGMNAGQGVPLWIRLVVGATMVGGVASLATGIVRRVGSGIYKLRPLHGLVTQVGSAAILVGASLTGAPVSATQVISSCVMGAGFAERRKGVHWLVAKDMLMSWFFTIPCAALLSWTLHVTALHWLSVLEPSS